MAGYFWYDPAYYTYIRLCCCWGGSPPDLKFHCPDCKRQYEGDPIEPDEMRRILKEHTYDQYSEEYDSWIIYGARYNSRLYWTMPEHGAPLEGGIDAFVKEFSMKRPSWGYPFNPPTINRKH